MIRNIVFDMGMVLLNWNPILPCLRVAKNQEMARKLCDAIFTHPEWGPMNDGGEMLEKDYFVRCRERMESDELRELGTIVEKDWWLDALYPMQGMDQVIEELLRNGFKLYILTNCGHRFHDFSYKIPSYDKFSGVLVSAEELMLKPNAEIYHRLFEKFDLKAEECIFIDDLQKNVDGAKAVGMDGYCFADGDAQKLLKHLLSMNA